MSKKIIIYPAGKHKIILFISELKGDVVKYLFLNKFFRQISDGLHNSANKNFTLIV